MMYKRGLPTAKTKFKKILRTVRAIFISGRCHIDIAECAPIVPKIKKTFARTVPSCLREWNAPLLLEEAAKVVAGCYREDRSRGGGQYNQRLCLVQ